MSSHRRPGFVLDVDRSTPPTLFMHGEGFRLERLPTGSRIVYPSEALPTIKDQDAAIRQALDNPLDSEPLVGLLWIVTESQIRIRGTDTGTSP